MNIYVGCCSCAVFGAEQCLPTRFLKLCSWSFATAAVNLVACEFWGCCGKELYKTKQDKASICIHLDSHAPCHISTAIATLDSCFFLTALFVRFKKQAYPASFTTED